MNDGPERKPLGFFGRLFSKLKVELPTQRDPDSFSNFTPRARQVLALARQEADRFNHNFVGTEHLLLGLIKLGQSVAVNVLQKMGLDLERVRAAVELCDGTGPDKKMIGEIPYTPRMKRVLALAAKEARALNHTYVGTEHFLLGVLREGDGVAARVLRKLDVDIEQTRKEILKELDPTFDIEPAELEQLAEASREPFPQNPLDSSKSEVRGMTGYDETMSNFTPDAQSVLASARREADRCFHNYVGSEHLLLGLARRALVPVGLSITRSVLQRNGVDYGILQKEIEKQVVVAPKNIIGNIPYAQSAKNVLALAAREAKALHHTEVDTEHLLLGLLQEADGAAARVMKNLGMDLEATRKEILKELDPRFNSGKSGS